MYYILLIGTCALLLSCVLFVSYRTYIYAFKRDANRQALEDEVPDSKLKMKIIKNIYSLMHEPFENAEIISHDGLRLKARYYHYNDDAPVAIIMHGYRSNYCRDGNGGFKIAKMRGMNILMPDQRAHGRSEGHTITFGAMERYDCLGWIKYIVNRFGKDTKIVLIGLSMGAATVMMTSDIADENNVKAIIADCGYTSARDIIGEVSTQIKIPRKAGTFFAMLGARIFGKFDPDGANAPECLAKTKIPVLFIHGDADSFVPCFMSKICFEKCSSYKEILIVKGATHGMSYYVDTKGYTQKVNDFLDRVL